jgi:hypothetical protein
VKKREDVSADWEVIHKAYNRHGTPTDTLRRLRVPGGWLYNIWSIVDMHGTEECSVSVSEALTFVPDPPAVD